MTSYKQFVEKTNLEPNELKPGDHVKDINPDCKEHGATGTVQKTIKLKQGKRIAGNKIAFKCTNSGKHWKKGEVLQKTEIQLKKIR